MLRRLSSDENWPVTRTMMRSSPASTTPDGVMAFCACKLWMTACWLMPSAAIWRVENSR
jgi:hypothetical protein